MCKKVKILAQVKSGELSYCEDCEFYHLIFNNLFFALSKKELRLIKSYIDGLEIAYWENKYACSNMRRKVPFPSSQKNLMIMFNRQEVIELQTLLNFRNRKSSKQFEFLNIDDIDYDLILN